MNPAVALFFKKNWLYILIFLIVVSVLIGVYFSGKKSGKKGKPEILELLNDVAGQPLGENEAREVREIALSLFDDLDGVNSYGRDEKVYQDFAALGNKQFAAVYEDFNNMYFKLEKGTLKDWIDDDYTLWGTEEYNLKNNIILPRFAKLGLV